MIRKVLIGFGAIVVLLLLYLLLWPIPLEPAKVTPQPMPDMTGDYEKNTILNEVELIGEGLCFEPEDVAFDAQGRIYSGMIGTGEIIRFQPDGTEPEVFAKTEGKPAGLAFDFDGNLIVADVEKGLLSISPDGKLTTLVDTYEGEKLYMINDLDIDIDGNIYFSQSSTKYREDELYYELMEHRPNGRLFVYSPQTKEVKVLIEELYFANGVAVSPDSSYVLVTETNAYRVSRYWLSGSMKGTFDTFIDNLPGLPDNIEFNGTDLYWLAIVNGPEKRVFLDSLLPKPFLRKIYVRSRKILPQSGATSGYAFVLGLNMDGSVAYNLQNPESDKYYNITSATEYNGYLYFGTNSSRLKGIGVIPLQEIEQ